MSPYELLNSLIVKFKPVESTVEQVLLAHPSRRSGGETLTYGKGIQGDIVEHRTIGKLNNCGIQTFWACRSLYTSLHCWGDGKRWTGGAHTLTRNIWWEQQRQEGSTEYRAQTLEKNIKVWDKGHCTHFIFVFVSCSKEIRRWHTCPGKNRDT